MAEHAVAASELGPQAAALGASRVGRGVAVAALAQRADVGRGGGCAGEPELQSVQGRAGREVLTGALERALELAQRRRGAAAPAADGQEAERAGGEQGEPEQRVL